MVMIKLLIFTGIRNAELAKIRLADVDLPALTIRIERGKGKKDRLVPIPLFFRGELAHYIESQTNKKATYLFESSWKKKYSERGVRKMLRRYANRAGLSQSISPHKLRHFFLLWLKKQGIDDALIQPYSGHAHRQSLEIYSQLAIEIAQQQYDQVMPRFPV